MEVKAKLYQIELYSCWIVCRDVSNSAPFSVSMSFATWQWNTFCEEMESVFPLLYLGWSWDFLFALHIEWGENDVPSEELVQFSWTLLELYPRNVINPCGPSGGLEDVWIGACPSQPRAWYISLQVAEPPSILEFSSRINSNSPGELQAGKDTQRSQQIAKQFTTT